MIRTPRLCLALVLAGAIAATLRAQTSNVLLVVADDLGVDMVGVYGEGPDPASTPTIDALAAQGVLFRNAWANPICSASRAVLLTGRYSFRTGVGHLVGGTGFGLGLEEVTLAEALSGGGSAAISCGAFGKWHLSSPETGGVRGPNLQGFERFAGSAGNLPAPPRGYFDWDLVEDGLFSTCQEYATSRTVDDALHWIGTRSGPWFCYVAFNAPHAPYHEPPDRLHSVPLAGLDPRCEPRPFYKAMIEALDCELGRLLTGIGPELDHTLVVFLADNGTPGECSLAPFLPGHAKLTPYEGGLNVPLVVMGSGVLQPGREVSALTDISDVFATLLEWSGGSPAKVLPDGLAIDSRSFAAHLRGPDATVHRGWVYGEHFAPNGPGGWGQALTDRALRGPRYKLIERIAPIAKVELYDLFCDPFEQQDRLAAPALSLADLIIAQALQAQLRELVH